MTDSASEGVAAEIARRHAKANVDPRKVGAWVKEGMPVTTVDAAEEWVKMKGRGIYGKRKSAEVREESSALDEILAEATMASSGVLGIYARARAIEVKTYQAIMECDAPTATMLAARKGAQDALVAAKDAVAEYLIQTKRLIDQSDIMKAVQAQDGASVALMASMPHTLAPLLVNQPIEVITATLASWRDETYFAKRREAYPFAEIAGPSEADRAIDAAVNAED